jgi:hypothetical protein
MVASNVAAFLSEMIGGGLAWAAGWTSALYVRAMQLAERFRSSALTLGQEARAGRQDSIDCRTRSLVLIALLVRPRER